MSDTELRLEQLLTTSEFTIPVTLDVNGDKKNSKKIMVTYDFNDEVKARYTEGKKVAKEVEDPDKPGEMKTVETTEPYTMDEQLAMMVTRIDGIDVLNFDLIKKMRFRYKASILEAVLRDIYPNAKISAV